MRAERNEFAQATDSVVMPPDAFLARLRPGAVVASYVPMGSEADPTQLAMAARAAGAIIALPFVTARAEPMAFVRYDDGDPLHPGPLGLRQPGADSPVLAPDIILTPLLAFDPACNRLGQGAGHYDRAFAAHPDAWRLGIAWSCQRVDTLTTDAWDMPLHAVVTEQGMAA